MWTDSVAALALLGAAAFALRGSEFALGVGISGYRLQVSNDSIDWRTLAIVGQSDTPNAHSYVDRSPVAGLPFYRLQPLLPGDSDPTAATLPATTHKL